VRLDPKERRSERDLVRVEAGLDGSGVGHDGLQR
jgi:hypothetical protein